MTQKTFVSGAVLYASDLNTALDSAGWTSYTPTFTNFTLGNGTIAAAYTQVGKTVTVRLKVTLGTTSSVSGSLTASLPLTAGSGYASSLHPIGTCILYNNTSLYFGLGVYASATTFTLRYNSGSAATLSTTTSTTPFTWASTHSFMATITYEAA
jgi:hypothetical protein